MSEALLRVQEVSKTFEGVRALDRVSFSVQKGQIKALIGPNGAGKTTLLNVINGLLEPDQGEIHILNRNLVGMGTDTIALLGLSRTFQLIRLFTVNQATVLDNVIIGGHKLLQPTIPEALFLRFKSRAKERRVRERAMELRLGTEVDGFYASSSFFNGAAFDFTGSILDASVRYGLRLNESLDGFLNLRFLGGTAKGQSQYRSGLGDDGYTDNSLNTVSLSLGFYMK